MTVPPELLFRDAPHTWINHHKTQKVRLESRLTLMNPGSGHSMPAMRQTAGHIQSIIQDAVADRVRLRAVGARWSFSEIGATKGGRALETDNLTMRFSVRVANLDSNYRGTAEELLLVQCGNSIHEINEAIEKPKPGRALRTSGASNGQTIAGAIATGTHGSAIEVGGMESQVAGLQLLTATRNIWLERPSDPVLTEAAAAQLGAELIRDDLLFRAALVNLGMLGVVHSVLLRTTRRYRLSSELRWMTMAEVARAMNTLDFTGVKLPDETRRPYFFQVIFDPADDQRAFVTTRYQEECPSDYPPVYDIKAGYEAGADVPAMVGKILNVAGGLRPLLASVLISEELKPFKRGPLTPGETYDFTSPKNAVAGAGLAVPVGLTTRAVELIRQAFRKHPSAPIVCACRYVQKSPALLGFTRFDPTCVFDIDGVNSGPTLKVMEEARKLFEREGIPFTEHWGKMNSLTSQRLRRNYGSDIDRWNQARHRLLPDPVERNIFSTPLFDSAGLNA